MLLPAGTSAHSSGAIVVLDAAGLGLFAVAGAQKGGGVVRDVAGAAGCAALRLLAFARHWNLLR